jgi:hypothetical protein
VEEGGGRKGADIRKNDQYGFEAPNRFLVLFCDQKRIPRAMRTFHKKHPPQNSETSTCLPLLSKRVPKPVSWQNPTLSLPSASTSFSVLWRSPHFLFLFGISFLELTA